MAAGGGEGGAGTLARKEARAMSTIIRHEFLGNRFVFWLLCMTGIGIPFAVLYAMDATVQVAEEVDDATEFLRAFRAGEL
jgi:hypothetical protein